MDFDELMEYSQKIDTNKLGLIKKPSNEPVINSNGMRHADIAPPTHTVKIVKSTNLATASNSLSKEASVHAITSNLFHKKAKSKTIAYVAPKSKYNSPRLTQPPTKPDPKPFLAKPKSLAAMKRNKKDTKHLNLVELNPIKRERNTIEDTQNAINSKKPKTDTEKYIPAIDRQRASKVITKEVHLNAPTIHKSPKMNGNGLVKHNYKNGNGTSVQKIKNGKSDSELDLDADLDNALIDENDEEYIKNNTSDVIRGLFGMRGRVYDDDSESDMETGYDQVRREELKRLNNNWVFIYFFSGRIAKREDEEDFELC